MLTLAAAASLSPSLPPSLSALRVMAELSSSRKNAKVPEGALSYDEIRAECARLPPGALWEDRQFSGTSVRPPPTASPYSHSRRGDSPCCPALTTTVFTVPALDILALHAPALDAPAHAAAALAAPSPPQLKVPLPFPQALYKPRSTCPKYNHGEPIKWLRPNEIYGADVTGAKTALISDGLEAGDVEQGELGDCYLLGAMSAIAAASDDSLVQGELFYKLLKAGDLEKATADLRKGFCTFLLYKFGSWTEVLMPPPPVATSCISLCTP